MEADEYQRLIDHGDRHWWFRSTRVLLRQLLAPHLASSPGSLLLDAAGATGSTGGWMAEVAPTVDADIEHGALKVGAELIDNYEPVQCDLNVLPFRDDAFSGVLCVTALCHRMNPDPGAIVREFARLTRPGGVICLMEPGGKRLWRGHDDVTHTGRRFSLKELKAIAEGAGLEIVKATGAYTFLVPPAAVMTKFEKGDSTSDVGRNQSGLFGVLGVFARLERLVMRRFNLPFGLSVIVVARKPV